jgi:hypothetical protein
VSGGAAAGAPRAAAGLALLALAHGAPPSVPPGTCPHPRLERAAGIPEVACAGAPDPVRAPTGAAGLLFGRPLDPNHASARALEALPGIGPARAEAIAHEARRRAFCAAEDLERVHGIGPVTRARLAGWLAVAPGACAP